MPAYAALGAKYAGIHFALTTPCQGKVACLVNLKSLVTNCVQAVEGSTSVQHKLEGAEAQNLSLTAQLSKRAGEVERALEHLVAARTERKAAVSATERTLQVCLSTADLLYFLVSPYKARPSHATP